MRLKLLCFFALTSLVSVHLFSQIKVVPVVTHVICEGNTNGAIVLTTSGGTAPYTYTWQPGNTHNSFITGQAVNDYTVTVKDAAANTFTASYGVGYKVCWQNMYVGTIVSGDDLVQNRSDGGSNWLQTGNSSNILHGNTDGWVEYVATTANQHKIIGLLDSASGSAYNNIDYGIYMKNDATLKTMNNGTQSAIGTYTTGSVIRIERVGNTINYKKDGSVIWTTTISSTMQQSRLTVRGAIYTYGAKLEKVGCSFSSVNAGASISNILTCTATTTSLSANTNVAGATFYWNPNGSAPTGSTTVVSSPGTYTLSVTNPTNSCIATRTIAVPINTVLPNVSAGGPKHITCYDLTPLLNGSSSTPGVTFTWTPGGSTPHNNTTEVSAPGTYMLAVTIPSTGCTASAYVGVVLDPFPVINPPYIMHTLSGMPFILGSNPTVSNMTAPVNYNWTQVSGPFTSSVANPVVPGITSNTTYSLYAFDNNDCIVTHTFVVNVVAPNSYAKLDKKINAGHYQVYNGKLYFAFYEEYRDLNQLNYKIYDDHRKLRLDPSVTAWAGAVKLGDNRYVIDLSAPGIGFSSADNGKFFVMEVTNEKQELVQVKFRYAQ